MKISPTVAPLLCPLLTVGKQRLAVRTAALVLLALSFSGAANASDPPGDIACGSTRYIVPGACMQQCKGRRTLANLNAGKCFLAPQTRELSDNQLLRQFYNQALFGAGPVPPPQSRVVLVAHILNVYYPPNKAPNFAINFGPTKEQFAGLTRASGPGQKPVLAISDDLLWLTPAFVVSTLGHEMIHMEQYKRTYKTDLNGINDAVAALRELEAYSWQLNRDNFARTFKVGSLFYSFQNTEQQETELNFRCAQWDVSNAIDNIVTGPRSLIYSKSLAAWLQEDPWVH